MYARTKRGYQYIFVWGLSCLVFACLGLVVREREREREIEGGRERERKKGRERESRPR